MPVEGESHVVDRHVECTTTPEIAVLPLIMSICAAKEEKKSAIPLA